MDRAARLIELPTITEVRGNISFLQEDDHVPFSIARVSWLDGDVAERTAPGRALCEVDEIVVALFGAIEVTVHDGASERRYALSRPCMALYIPRMHWRELHHISADALVLVLASGGDGDTDSIADLTAFEARCRQ